MTALGWSLSLGVSTEGFHLPEFLITRFGYNPRVCAHIWLEQMLQVSRLHFENSLLMKRSLLPEQPRGRMWCYGTGSPGGKEKSSRNTGCWRNNPPALVKVWNGLCLGEGILYGILPSGMTHGWNRCHPYHKSDGNMGMFRTLRRTVTNSGGDRYKNSS